MKAWKWTALVVSGGMLLQLNACVTDFAYYVMQLLVNQLLAQLLANIGTSA